MKNIPVGRKLLLGFGAVIMMIVLILGISVVTSTTRNSDLGRSALMSDLQREANGMLDNFNLARVEIRSVFTSIHADTEYEAAMGFLDVCDKHMANMESLSTQLGGYMSEDIQELRKMFGQVRDSLVAVHSNDGQANASIATMMENGTLMSDSMTKVANIVVKVVLDVGSTDFAMAMDRVENVIPAVFALNDDVNDTRIESRELMLNQNTAIIPGLYTALDTLVQDGNTLRPMLSTEEARKTVDTMISSVEGFRNSISEVEGILQSSEQEIAKARTTFLDLAALVDGYVSTISSDVSAMNQNVISTSQVTMVIIVIVGVAAAVFSVLVALYLSQAITRPLIKMKNAMEQAGKTGNLRFSEETKEDIRKEGAAKDEIGQSLNAFSKFVEQITYMADCLKAIADRDLSVDVRLLGDEDTMGVAMKNMLDNLNDIFNEINHISTQVAASSHEVAIGAQTLAQGSTEQAATVQEISASVVEINDQMNLSSDTATSAVEHGTEIGNIANDGNDKMNHLIGSMTEINDASQAIGRVIKVIDDIAFQTNILALNAAVEAARAGQHGKGFAVVADEVRNLAAKSAEAAKETADLISTNIEKTEQGLAFTQSTAESLTKIIEGIQQTNESLKMVAEQSQGTKVATSQVTAAIDQVSVVIQQNSATSEESAAASEEMSSQAQILQEYISRFKLRGQAGTYEKSASVAVPVEEESTAVNTMPMAYPALEKY